MAKKVILWCIAFILIVFCLFIVAYLISIIYAFNQI